MATTRNPYAHTGMKRKEALQNTESGCMPCSGIVNQMESIP